MSLISLATRQELEQRNEDSCPICRMDYDLSLVPDASSSNPLDRRCALIKMILSTNKNTEKPVRRRARILKAIRGIFGSKKKNDQLTFQELARMLAEAPKCLEQPVTLQCGHIFGAACLLGDFKSQRRKGGELLCAYCRQSVKWNCKATEAYTALYEASVLQFETSKTPSLAVSFSNVIAEGRKMTSMGPCSGERTTQIFRTLDPTAVLLFEARKRILGRGIHESKDAVDPKAAFDRLAAAYLTKFPSSAEEESRSYAAFTKAVIGKVIEEQLWHWGMTLADTK